MEIQNPTGLSLFLQRRMLGWGKNGKLQGGSSRSSWSSPHGGIGCVSNSLGRGQAARVLLDVKDTGWPLGNATLPAPCGVCSKTVWGCGSPTEPSVRSVQVSARTRAERKSCPKSRSTLRSIRISGFGFRISFGSRVSDSGFPPAGGLFLHFRRHGGEKFELDFLGGHVAGPDGEVEIFGDLFKGRQQREIQPVFQRVVVFVDAEAQG